MPTGDRLQLRRRLVRVAAEQSGYFTAAQALAAGYSYPAQRYHVSRGNWSQVDRAIFRLHDWPSDLHEHLVLWTLWAKGRAVVSHDTALSLHDLGDANPARIHLTVPPGFRRRAPALELHAADLPDSDVQPWKGFRVTTPLRSVADAAGGAQGDLDQLATTIEDGLRRGAFSRRQLLYRTYELEAPAALAIERALRLVDERAS
jgi:hypothetical protein